ncbi:hypothetical protein COLO4_07220 [Corchorus olitorius]|uniref:Uncharacterized protein n=1 Tax=Corchorus olitorius TaxID=93759 RepID=A0A1R3KKG5_9ROSI|nr:hypothetical protein COLO4_07220 [Corchorus olitorius]
MPLRLFLQAVSGQADEVLADKDVCADTASRGFTSKLLTVKALKLCKFSLVKFSKIHQPSYRKGSSTRLDFSPYSASLFKYWKGLLESVEFATAEEASECVVGLEDGEEVWQLEAICYFC